MAIKRTKWIPDTCGCEIEFEWDDSVPSDQRAHNLHTYHKKCAYHKALDDLTSYGQVKTENTTKNMVLGAIIDNFPSLSVDDNGSKVLASEYEYVWKFDDARELEVEVKGPVPDIILSSMQGVLDSSIGSGRVTFKTGLSADDVVIP